MFLRIKSFFLNKHSTAIYVLIYLFFAYPKCLLLTIKAYPNLYSDEFVYISQAFSTHEKVTIIWPFFFVVAFGSKQGLSIQICSCC